MESIIIGEIKNSGNRIDVDLTVSDGLKKYFNNTHFFAEYSCDISDVPDSVAVLPVLLNLLPFSWLADCIVWATEVDSVFYDAVMRLKNGFRELYPDLKLGGTLIAAKRIDNRYEPEREAMALFTGGIDATTTFLRIKDKKPILFNTNGWYQDEIKQDDVYDADKADITEIAVKNGVEACFVRSDFATFISGGLIGKTFLKGTKTTWWFGFQHSMAFLGCAVVTGYHYKVKSIYIASSYTMGQQFLCVSDPRIDSEIKCASMNVIHDGYELSRQNKVRAITGYCKETGQSVRLRVCSFNDHNCCMCEKCFRSMLAIAAEGGEDMKEYGFTFDGTLLSQLKKFLQEHIVDLDGAHVVYWYDIIARMKENYENMKHKEVYDFLKNFDFEKERKRYLFRYYRKNFFRIIKRKLFHN